MLKHSVLLPRCSILALVDLLRPRSPGRVRRQEWREDRQDRRQDRRIDRQERRTGVPATGSPATGTKGQAPRQYSAALHQQMPAFS